MEYSLHILSNSLNIASEDYRIAKEKLFYSKLYKRSQNIIDSWNNINKELSDNITSLKKAISILEKAENLDRSQKE